MNTIATPESSNIRAVGYDPISNEMEVDFKTGGKYLYLGVPENVYKDFLHASSKGKFFHSNVRDIYKCTKLK